MLARFILAAIQLYQRWLSPLLGSCCRFEPSCSRYAALCVKHHGAGRGSWLALKRIARCNPLCAAGYDPPPLPDGAPAKDLEPDWYEIQRRYGLVATTGEGSAAARSVRSSEELTP